MAARSRVAGAAAAALSSPSLAHVGAWYPGEASEETGKGHEDVQLSTHGGCRDWGGGRLSVMAAPCVSLRR